MIDQVLDEAADIAFAEVATGEASTTPQAALARAEAVLRSSIPPLIGAEVGRTWDVRDAGGVTPRLTLRRCVERSAVELLHTARLVLPPEVETDTAAAVTLTRRYAHEALEDDELLARLDTIPLVHLYALDQLTSAQLLVREVDAPGSVDTGGAFSPGEVAQSLWDLIAFYAGRTAAAVQRLDEIARVAEPP